MKIVKEQFECPIELEEGRVAVLILEKQEKFTDFVSELKEQLSDNDSGWKMCIRDSVTSFLRRRRVYSCADYSTLHMSKKHINCQHRQ